MRFVKKPEFIFPSCVLLAGLLWIRLAEELSTSNGLLSHVISVADQYRDGFFVIAIAITLFFILRGHRRKSVQSEKQYQALFDCNPVPMWIFDRATLAFLAVNGAAVKQYGFTKAEFLTMTLRDIRPASEQAMFDEYVAKESRNGRKETTWKHCKKMAG